MKFMKRLICFPLVVILFMIVITIWFFCGDLNTDNWFSERGEQVMNWCDE